MSHERQTISELVPKIKRQGFRVFLAGSERYGFFTDEDGTRVISFQVDYLSVSFSGNYKTDAPGKTGTGWRITDNDTGNYKEIFNSYPPQWATSDSKWKYTTLKQHLGTYQKSSKYTEVES